MSLPVLGIDVAKERFAVALPLPGKVRQHSFANQPGGYAALSQWLSRHGVTQVHACLEATGRYGEELALYLHAAGHTVSIVNPKRIHDYAQSQLRRTKTDALDAALIADFCATQRPPAWTPPPPEVRELQALLHQLAALQQMHAQEQNRLAAGGPSVVVHATLQAHLDFLAGQIAQLQQHIADHIDRHPDLKQQHDLLTSIPGIGHLTSARLLSAHLHTYASSRAVAAYAGLSPAQHLSGKSVHRKSQISKVGNPRLRQQLYFPAIVAMRYNPIIKAFCDRLRQKGKCNMQIIAAAMRKLLCLAFGVLKSGKPFDPSFAHSSSAIT